MLKRFCFLLLCLSCTAGLTTVADSADSIYPAAKLGQMIIHMAKITAPSKGSSPAIEMLFSSDKFAWEPSELIGNWGKPDKTQKYYEPFVPGTRIFFSITNRLDDVTYYRTVGAHPYNVPLYSEPDEAEFMKRFVFFKFTATAAKGLSLFTRHLNNDLGAFDTPS